MKINSYYLNLIMLTFILPTTNQADLEKTIYVSGPKFFNSVTCVSVSFFFPYNGVEDNGELLVRLRELNEDGHETNWITEVDHIQLKPEMADFWTNRSRTVHFDHAEMFVVSVLHKMPVNSNKPIEVFANVFLDNNQCQTESLPDYQIESTTKSVLPSTKSSDKQRTTEILSDIVTQPPVTIWTLDHITSIETSTYDGQMSTQIKINQQSTLSPTIYSTKLDTITIPTGDSPVTTDYTNNSYSSTEPTVVSTTINDHVDETSTKENQSNTPTIIIIISTTTTNYDGQMFKNSTAEESFSYTDSTQLTTTIKDSSNASIHSDVAVVDTANDTHEAKTGNFGDDLIVSIQLLTKKRYLIYSIFCLVGLIVVLASLTITFNRLNRNTWQPNHPEVSINPSAVELDVVTFHRRTINSNILKVLSDYRKSRKSMAETVIQFKK